MKKRKKFKKSSLNYLIFLWIVGILLFTIAVFKVSKIFLKSKAEGNLSLISNRPNYSGLNFYYGDLHAHSGYSSDSFGRPEDAYDYAISSKNDFYALTDHDEAFIYNPYLCLDGIDNSLAGTPNFSCKPDKKINVGTAQKWENLKRIANEKNNNGSFVALYGYEWTHSPGHVNIINAPTFVNFGYSLGNLYNGLYNHPDKEILIAQFNHPQETNFDNFILDNRVKNIFSLIETNIFSVKYPVALNKGWKVGAVGYGDNHNYLQGATRRYGLVSSELTKESVLNALKNGNTFAVLEGRTFSENYPLALAIKINNVLMGGNVSFNGSVDYEIFTKDTDKNIEKIKLLYGGNYSATTYTAKEFSVIGKEAVLKGAFSDFAFSSPQRAKYMYIEVYQKNDKGQLVVSGISSPIWINYTTNPVTPTLIPTLTRTPIISPILTPVSNLICTGGCYGSISNCAKNCKTSCLKLNDLQRKEMCGWSTGVAYRCCK